MAGISPKSRCHRAVTNGRLTVTVLRDAADMMLLTNAVISTLTHPQQNSSATVSLEPRATDQTVDVESDGIVVEYKVCNICASLGNALNMTPCDQLVCSAFLCHRCNSTRFAITDSRLVTGI